MRDVTKEVSNMLLKKRNERNKEKLKMMRYSNENVAHEMRTPLGSIIVIINILLSLGSSPTEWSRIQKYYKQIKF